VDAGGGTAPSPIAEVPTGFATGYAGVSSDGTRLCIPAIAEAALADLKAIDRTVLRLGLASHLWVFDTSSGALVDDIEVAGGWVTHVQFRPGDATVLLYNHEWADGGGERRMWIRDAGGDRRLRDAVRAGTDTPIQRDDDVDHEIWTRDGRFVLYHGTYAPGPGPLAGRAFVGRVAVATGQVEEIAIGAELLRYGHLGVGPANLIVTDGYAGEETPVTQAANPNAHRWDGADAPGEDDGGSWISLLDVSWERRTVGWRPVAPHGSSWSSQDAHPHPTIDHAGTGVIFTSDREGCRAVYRAAIPTTSAPG
jgi:hypothetical protein